MKLLLVSWVLVSMCVACSGDKSLLKTEFKWKYFDYVWKSEAQKKWYAASGQYLPEALTPIDVARSQDGRTFVTIIRAPGVPASLNVVSKKHGESGPLLEPYPDWSWYDHTYEPCKGILNVYRVAIDKCNRLWVMDTGSVNFKDVCPAKLMAFDLSTNNLLFYEEFSDKLSHNAAGAGLLITPIVETSGCKCEDTTVYIGDVTGHGLIVWRPHESVRLEDLKVFGPEARYDNHTIANETFFLDDGIMGMDLSPKLQPNGQRYLVFRPFASISVYAANTRQLKQAIKGGKVVYVKAKDVLASPSSTQAFASDGTLFLGLTEQLAIGCWNIGRPMSRANFKIALVDEKRLQFASGMKVFRDPVKPEDEYLLVMTNRLQKIYDGSISQKEINYRVLMAPVKELVKEGRCNE